MVLIDLEAKEIVVIKKYKLTDNEAELLKIINNSTLDSLIKELYGNVKVNEYKPRIYQTISRLRSKGVDIKTRNGIGYRLENARFKKKYGGKK